MKTTLSFLKKYKKEVVLGPLFKLIEATFELFVPLVVASIIDRGIGGGDKGLVVRSSLLMVLLGVLGLVFAVTAQYFCAKAAVGFGTDVRKSLFAKIQSLSYSSIDSQGTGKLITRMTSDVNSMQNGVNLVLRLVLRSPFIVIGAAVMAFTVDPESAFWFVIVIPVLSLVVLGITLITVPLHKKVQKKLEDVFGLCEENAGGARVIRAFCAEETETERFISENRVLYSLQKAAGRFSALLNPVTYVIINAATIALLWTGAVRVDTGAVKVGAVVALFNYMSQILVELLKFANVIVSVIKAKASCDRVEAVLLYEEEKTPEGCEKRFDGKVTFENVTFSYSKNAEPSLEGISFTVHRGETVGIIGGTGSGKTTLINLIGGFYPPTEGTVAVDGRDVLLWDREELLSRIAVVPQKAVLFKGTVRDNLLWGKKATDEELWEALRCAQADGFIAEKEGLDTPVEQNGRNFSGGQRQRLTVARALVRQGEILILDDSSSALDFATDAAMRKAIKSLPNEPTVFIVSQRTSSIMHADRIVVLDDGRAVGIGRHDELLSSCPVYREIYESQFKSGGER
ncbi:MAG: ABC transporter ATP-binding protein [Ruminococcaceae bacterium]|nr:ABC transporter ATP-binding protein [Oscillospiraceae bacterium]